LTTCGETGFASHDRSDCHAWSAHPAYYMLSSVCGIKPADVGFNTIKIEPHLGDLTWVKADMPHPKGTIEAEYKIKKGRLTAKIHLPEKMNGELTWGGRTYLLKEGQNTVQCSSN